MRRECMTRGISREANFGHVNMYPWKHVPLDVENREHMNSMMDWTRLVSNLLNIIPKKLPRDCRLRGYNVRIFEIWLARQLPAAP